MILHFPLLRHFSRLRFSMSKGSSFWSLFMRDDFSERAANSRARLIASCSFKRSISGLPVFSVTQTPMHKFGAQFLECQKACLLPPDSCVRSKLLSYCMHIGLYLKNKLNAFRGLEQKKLYHPAVLLHNQEPLKFVCTQPMLLNLQIGSTYHQ